MPEVVKRLPPTPTTLRSLYLKSGNLCAHPGCPTSLLTNAAAMVGDICHIRAAEKKGPRFDKGMTNETRRAADNLVLMCASHHRKIDKELKTYTVERLLEIKRDHEKRFSEVEDTMMRRFEEQYRDETDSLDPSAPVTFKRFNDVVDAGLDEAGQAALASKQIAKYARKLGLLAEGDRKIVGLLVRRARKVGRQTFFGSSASVDAHQFAETHKMSKSRLNRFAKTLEEFGLGGLYEADYKVFHVGLNDPADAVTWLGIAKFCHKKNVDLEDIAVHLKFGLLD